MNCLDFRRRLLTDPFATDHELDAHAQRCAACANFARELRAQEVALRQLLQSAAPPSDLAGRILHSVRGDRRTRIQQRWWFSAAAGLLLAIGVSFASLISNSLERGHAALAQSVLTHLDDEAHHLHEVGPVSSGRLQWVFKRFGAELVQDIGPVNFAAECLMRNRTGVHLVLPGTIGPVTVFFMPDEMTDATLPVDSARFHGRILPTRWGSIAVVGEPGEALDGIGERLADAVRWPHAAVAQHPPAPTAHRLAGRSPADTRQEDS